MPGKKELNDFYMNLSKEIQLSQTAVNTIDRTFNSIKDLVVKDTDYHSDVITFPQGSCSLGTTIKPLTGNDDFDVDIIFAVKEESISALNLKMNVGNILSKSSQYKDKVKEKGRAWRVDYYNSHVDVVPALINSDGTMLVTNRKNDGSYEYINSNPQGFTEWFKKVCLGNDWKNVKKFESKPIHVYSNHSVLQKVVQILKYHRNVFCKKLPEKQKPISMLITIMAAELYNNEENVFDALSNILIKMPGYLEQHKDIYGNYKIVNPIDKEEVFTDKWKEHPERMHVFIDWSNHVREDLIYGALEEDRTTYVQRLKPIFNEFVGKSYELIGEKDQINQQNNVMSYKKDIGIEFNNENESFKRNTFWGN